MRSVTLKTIERLHKKHRLLFSWASLPMTADYMTEHEPKYAPYIRVFIDEMQTKIDRLRGMVEYQHHTERYDTLGRGACKIVRELCAVEFGSAARTRPVTRRAGSVVVSYAGCQRVEDYEERTFNVTEYPECIAQAFRYVSMIDEIDLPE